MRDDDDKHKRGETEEGVTSEEVLEEALEDEEDDPLIAEEVEDEKPWE